MKLCWNWLLISLFTDKTLVNYNTEIYKSTAIANRQFKWSFFKKAHKSWPKTIFVCASDISENLGSILISIFYDKSTFHKQKIKIKKKKEKKTENTFKFLNVEIMVNICKFQEYLGNSRKFISQYKEPKFACISLFVKILAFIYHAHHKSCWKSIYHGSWLLNYFRNNIIWKQS